ncbi:MAG: undecaprenyldiphospho-muramoylpentapeptide beta-N-acetylglucosaminyltransferase [Alteromonadaceae bacterium]|nr:undecaprenyldiphospho-muramoylpentapeptide beta-N-acetylglucosaminyltransferase [Alteromonadaceae bacterium]|tara:strand:- start:2966 stop:4054 length:1089 start_codon:yes stop_codon:yes gene_type:complete
MSKRFLVMAGGTGGHVFPALATARMLQQLGHEVQWLGSRGGMEERLVKAADMPVTLIRVSGLRGKGRLALAGAPFTLVSAVWQASALLRRARIDCVIGMGGFASGPGGLAAWLMRKPLVIHEQNAVAGLTNRVLSRFATTVLEAFPKSFGPNVVTRLTGNPVRREFSLIEPPPQRFAARAGQPLRLLVLGGSLGAQAINAMVPEALALLAADARPQVRHQAGERHLAKTQEDYEKRGITAEVVPFIEDIDAAYGWADLVLCRAGALTIAELCAAGVGAILVPFPHAVDDHQTRNGKFMVDGEAALMVAQSELEPNALAGILSEFASDRPRLLVMAEAARKLARPDATERVVNYCLEAANASQ